MSNTARVLTLINQQMVAGEIIDWGKDGVIIRLDGGKEIGVKSLDYQLIEKEYEAIGS